jgi:hypothetical protein
MESKEVKGKGTNNEVGKKQRNKQNKFQIYKPGETVY